MGSIIFIFFLIWLFKNTSSDRRRSENMKRMFRTIIGIIIAVGIFGELMPFLAGLITLGGFGLAGWYILKNIEESRKAKERKQRYGWDPQKWDRDNNNTRTYTGTGANDYRETKTGTYHDTSKDTYRETTTRTNSRTAAYQGQQPGSTTLPKLVKKRRAILEDFNAKYSLDLTTEQITSIVNSSYMSEVWRTELEAMDRRYETVYEWLQGPTNWLRVYMHAFHIQEITSDIMQQENIAMYSFETIFQYVDNLGPMQQSKKIQMVNDKFFTSFDDVTFMIAYRFLEKKGLYHDLKAGKLARNVDSAEDLVEKYAKMNFEDASDPDEIEDILDENSEGMQYGL